MELRRVGRSNKNQSSKISSKTNIKADNNYSKLIGGPENTSYSYHEK